MPRGLERGLARDGRAVLAVGTICDGKQRTFGALWFSSNWTVHEQVQRSAQTGPGLEGAGEPRCRGRGGVPLLGLEGLTGGPRCEREQGGRAGKLLSRCELAGEGWLGGREGVGKEAGGSLESAESHVVAQMPWIRERKFIDEVVRLSQEKSAYQCRSFIPWEASVLKTYTLPPCLALAVEHKDTLWDLPAVWEKSRVLGSRLPPSETTSSLFGIHVSGPSTRRYCYREASPFIDTDTHQGLLPGPGPGVGREGASSWGAQPTLWAPPGDPQAEPKACWREVGSF